MRIIGIVRTYNLSSDCIFGRKGCFEYKKYQKLLCFSIGELHTKGNKMNEETLNESLGESLNERINKIEEINEDDTKGSSFEDSVKHYFKGRGISGYRLIEIIKTANPKKAVIVAEKEHPSEESAGPYAVFLWNDDSRIAKMNFPQYGIPEEKLEEVKKKYVEMAE